ncbi:unnamed protein product [Pieris macdunnoughi]|uniref:Uncharacterized protein n=1 Tax=Pieris macdunnoughi TaxID=345717 RepID=A0A821LTI7_9NEOP|nr:unnamed protein product [Pieris macdunnoughi]
MGILGHIYFPHHWTCYPTYLMRRGSSSGICLYSAAVKPMDHHDLSDTLDWFLQPRGMQPDVLERGAYDKARRIASSWLCETQGPSKTNCCDPESSS